MGILQSFNERTFSALKVRNYRLYFMGQAVSIAGTFMQMIAQAWLVLTLTSSGTALGIVAALQVLPVLLFSPWAGVIADRYRKRKLLYLTQGTSGILALILGILVLTGTVQIWMVYILALLLGIVNCIDNPTRQSFVFEMVGKEEIRNAVTLNAIVINLARVIGSAIAGVVIVAIGVGECFILNALSFVAVIIALWMMNEAELHRSEIIPMEKGQMMAGFRYVMSTPILRNVLVMVAIIGTLTYEFQVILPLLAQFTFHGNAGTYAALTAIMSIGSIICGLVVASRKETTFKMFVFAVFMLGLSVLLTSVMPTLLAAEFAIAIVGFFSVYFISVANTILQLESLPEMRGRVMSFWSMAFIGSTAIGGPIIGYICEHAGPRIGLVVGGTAALIASGYGWVAIRKNRKLGIANSRVKKQ